MRNACILLHSTLTLAVLQSGWQAGGPWVCSVWPVQAIIQKLAAAKLQQLHVELCTETPGVQ